MSQLATFMQIDLQNLFYAAKTKGERLDFEKIWDYFHARETEFLTDAIMYMIRGEDFDSLRFEKKLESIGYSLKIKTAVKMMHNRRPIYKQSNHDVNITIDCMDRISSFDKLILMSGDGDFVDLCQYLRKKGKQVEVWSFKECYNSILDPHIDRLHFIDDNFFLKKSGVSVFGFNRGAGLECDPPVPYTES